MESPKSARLTEVLVTVDTLKEKTDNLASEVKETRDITKYFTIIVGITLVATFIATLIGLVGLYIGAFDRNIEAGLENREIIILRQDIRDFERKTNDYEAQQVLLRNKYPWIKELK